MCIKREEIKNKHKDYNYCPYCGRMLNKYGFVTDYSIKPNSPYAEVYYGEERNK